MEGRGVNSSTPPALLCLLAAQLYKAFQATDSKLMTIGSHIYKAKETRLQRARTLSGTLVLIVYTTAPCVCLVLYKFFFVGAINIANSGFLILIGIMLGTILLSFVKAPAEFIIAIFERIKLLGAVAIALLLHALSLLWYLVGRVGRLIISTLITLLYGLSPIDLLPDIFLGVGQLDDFGVFLGSFYWALRGLSLSAFLTLNQRAKELIDDSRIRTRFP